MFRHLAQISVLIIAVLFSSCKKDSDLPDPEPTNACDTTFVLTSDLDTVFPNEYLAAYPGSWWEYDNGDINSCVEWSEQSEYSMVDNGGCVTVTEKKYLMSTLGVNNNTLNSYIYGDYVLRKNGIYNSNLDQMFGPGVGSNWHVFTSSLDESSDLIVERDYHTHLDSMLVNGTMYYDVAAISTISQIHYPETSTSQYSYSHYYYAKDIGVIKQIDQNIFGQTDSMKLVNYYIAPH